jgi:hypothetical protein
MLIIIEHVKRIIDGGWNQPIISLAVFFAPRLLNMVKSLKVNIYTVALSHQAIGPIKI